VKGRNEGQTPKHWFIFLGDSPPAMVADRLLGIIREMRWSYLPPLMVYLARDFRVHGIIETFFVKESLGLSAAFLAALVSGRSSWALKMPLVIW